MTSSQIHAPAAPAQVRKERDETAVASFILGLVGLVFFNIVLGPLAIVLGAVTLVRGTRRRWRAALGIALGVADLVVLGVLMSTQQGGFVWHFGA